MTPVPMGTRDILNAMAGVVLTPLQIKELVSRAEASFVDSVRVLESRGFDCSKDLVEFYNGSL